jgi:hypothetical protein
LVLGVEQQSERDAGVFRFTDRKTGLAVVPQAAPVCDLKPAIAILNRVQRVLHCVLPRASSILLECPAT